MSGTDSTAQPSDERQTNRTRRPPIRQTPRAGFPSSSEDAAQERRATVLRGADLDTSDPSAGGGRGFTYQWEDTAAVLQEQIQTVAAGGVISYTHHQTVPAASWVIDHHMGLIPNVFLLDDNGEQMIAEIRHPSDQTTIVVHGAPYTGTAYLRP